MLNFSGCSLLLKVAVWLFKNCVNLFVIRSRRGIVQEGIFSAHAQCSETRWHYLQSRCVLARTKHLLANTWLGFLFK